MWRIRQNRIKKTRPFFKKKRFYALSILVILIGMIYQFSKFRTTDKEYISFFKEQGYTSFEVDTVMHLGRKVRYVVAGSGDKPILMMIHGSPASSTFWKGFFEDSTLRSTYRLAAIDRPGYGFSGFGRLVTDIKFQSDALHRVIQKIDPTDEVDLNILASSYGGSVAAKYAMDHSDRLNGVIFQSSSLLPGKEYTFAFSYWTRPKWIASLLPTTIRMANKEKLSHAKELEKIQDGWDRITTNVVFLHGDDDELVYPENAIWCHDKCVNANSRKLVLFRERGHDLYWTQRENLIQELVDLSDTNKVQTKPTVSN